LSVSVTRYLMAGLSISTGLAMALPKQIAGQLSVQFMVNDY
jgi:hypothetical protein